MKLQIKASDNNQGLEKIPLLIKTSIIRSSLEEPSLRETLLNQLPSPSSLLKQTCMICLSSYPPNQLAVIKQCSHKFCLSCMRLYLLYRLQSMQTLNCPQQNCQGAITPQDELFNSLPEELQQKYQRLQLWQQTIRNPNIKLCPSQHCKGLAIKTQNYFKCNKCNMEYCAECMYERHEGRCDINFQKNYREWKKCPNCKIFITKSQGCNHMTCIACNHQFCLLCLKDWQPIHDCTPYNSPLLTNVFNMQSIAFSSSCSRKLKGVLFLLLFPLTLLLGFLFLLFIMVAVAIILLFLNICTAKSKFSIPCWVSILFYPLVYLYVLAKTQLQVVSDVCRSLTRFYTTYLNTIKAYFYYEEQDDNQLDVV